MADTLQSVGGKFKRVLQKFKFFNLKRIIAALFLSAKDLLFNTFCLTLQRMRKKMRRPKDGKDGEFPSPES